MKTLTLLRHAKSGPGEPGQRDFDRTLNSKGQHAATAMGRHLRALGDGFDQVIASPAQRVVDTLDWFARGFGQMPDPHFDKRAYLPSATMLLDLIHKADAAVDRLLIVAHNPGLEDLVLDLVPDSTRDTVRGDIEEKFPTASAATISFDVDDWAGVAEGNGRLVRFVRPRDLDPALGPDPF